jgi:uncharacterized metal-binding protein YceD (DUF177 family)
VKDLKEFTIPFSGLSEGKHTFEFEVNKRFFEVFEYSDIEDADISVALTLNKLSTFFDIEFTLKGKVHVACDICTELFWQAIKNHKKIVVKFGEEFNDEDDELIVIPRSESSLNVALYIYEQIILALPSRMVHPKGECNEEMIAHINKYRINEEKKDDIDPRWAGLKNLN